MKIIELLRFRKLPLVLGYSAFVGVFITFLNPVFNHSTRWLFLAILCAFVATRRTALRWLKTSLGKLILLHLAWVLLTILWSDVPRLSFLKGMAFLLVVYGFVSASRLWTVTNGTNSFLHFMAPIVFFALIAAVFGQVSDQSYYYLQIDRYREVGLYRGLTGGPNTLGQLMAMISPFVVWKIYSGWNEVRARMLWILILVTVALALGMSTSRGAILVFFSIIFAATLNLRGKTRATLMVLTLIITPFSLTVAPEVIDKAKERFIFKFAPQEQSVLFTREQVWHQSYENAKVGGWTGVGFGVTTGDNYFQGGLTALGYGREKGNTQLAIVEETGIVGLITYTLILLSAFQMGINALRRRIGRNLKMQILLVLGAIVGWTFNSVFEAWWVAPGSGITVNFWCLIGVLVGLNEISIRQNVLNGNRLRFS